MDGPDDPDLTALAGVPWPELNHRDVRARLEALGWVKCGEGDWAIALRSPGGALAARVSAFEPSYDWFVELCRRGTGNPYFPRIDLVAGLEGGGHLTVLEYLTHAGEDAEAAFLRRWQDDADPEPDLRHARALAEDLDRHCRAHVPFWMGVDLEDHVMRAADGHLRLIDVLGVGGGGMTDLIHTDMDAFLAILPRERWRYFLEIPHFSRDYAAAQRDQLVADLAVYDRRCHRSA